MIVSIVGNDVFPVTDALLKNANGNALQHYFSVANLTQYLGQHPDTDFLLEAVHLGPQIAAAVPHQYTPANGFIKCGQVKHESASNCVVCT